MQLKKEVVTSFEVLSRLVKWWPSVLIGCLKLKNSFLCFYSKLAVLSNSSGTMIKSLLLDLLGVSHRIP